MRKSAALLSAAAALCGSSPAQQPSPPPGQLTEWQQRMQPITPRGYICHKATSAPVIDGKPDDKAWDHAPWTDDFVDIEGDAKPKPKFRTRAKMLWDENFLYITADLEEPHVWGTITQHDAVIFQDPDFEVFIDPNGDSHEYYEFEMNALNTGWDLFLPKPYKDGGPAMNAWEIPGLRTAVHVRGTINDPSDTDDGWSVEIAIPWKVLGEAARRPSPPTEGDQWRLGFSRVEWQTDVRDGKYVKRPATPENNWIWSAQGIIDMHRPERWGYVQFTSKPPGTTSFIPDPSAPARNRLHEVYYAQRDFRARQQRWAERLSDLGLAATPANGAIGVPVIHLTPDGYLCIVELKRTDNSTEVWSIRHDALIQQLPHKP